MREVWNLGPTRNSSDRHPTIDLATVRETLDLMRDDLAGAPHLAAVERALTEALAAIDAVEPTPRGVSVTRLREQTAARFVAWLP